MIVSLSQGSFVVGGLETAILSVLAIAGGTYGHVGLAIAYLFGTIASAVLLTAASLRRFERSELPGAVAVAGWAVLYAAVGALLGGALLTVARPVSLIATWLALAAALAVGGGIYLLLLTISGVPGIRDMRLAIWGLVRRPASPRS